MKKLFILLFACLAINSFGQHTLFIPDTLSGTSFNLRVHRDSVQFISGKKTHTLGINSQPYLGPTLFINKGDSISLNVINEIGDTTTMHWHGLHVAAKNDGGPQSMIMDGMNWNPQFVVRNNASLYWYHPHFMQKTASQAIKGDAGLIIVRDAAEAALTLPRRYGVDDFPIVVQSVELDTQNQFMPKGMVDSIVLVNGTLTPTVSLPAQVVRMRVLNGSGERTFNFGFTANKSFYVIGNDGGLLNAPVSTTRIRLSPGERAELLLDLSGMLGQNINLMSYASEIPMGVQGGPTMPMPPGSPLMNSPLNGIDFNILAISIAAQTVAPITTIPTSLVSDVPYSASSANATRFINMTADSMMVMDGPFYFNHNLFMMDRIDYNIPLNNTEIWTLYDSTMVAHPFHLHDTHFYILDRNGVAPPATEQGRKDVLLIQPNETVRFIAKFEDFADTTTPYMYHCHILMHEDDGMMGQFIVGTTFTGITKQPNMANGVLVFPNPVKGILHIQLKENTIAVTTIYKIYDACGREIMNGTIDGSELQINISNRPKGVYSVQLINNEKIESVNFVVE